MAAAAMAAAAMTAAAVTATTQRLRRRRRVQAQHTVGCHITTHTTPSVIVTMCDDENRQVETKVSIRKPVKYYTVSVLNLKNNRALVVEQIRHNHLPQATSQW